MFAKKPKPMSPALVRQAADSNVMASTFSVLGADVAIKGDITASADLHIDGHVEGDITCAALVQGEASVIHGAIKAQSARLAGTVHGGVEVAQLTIWKSARIHGDVAYGAVTMEQGAQVEGRLSHGLPGTDGETALILVD
jgi:cytoskeletal protein CcmA (bactofilin family)